MHHKSCILQTYHMLANIAISLVSSLRNMQKHWTINFPSVDLLISSCIVCTAKGTGERS